MKTTKRIFALAAVALLAMGVSATNILCSVETSLDTRSLSQAVVDEDKALDSRSYTVDWSDESILNTEKIVGTLLLLR